MTPNYAFAGEPETNGVIERFFRTLKEQIVHGQIYQTIDEVRDVVRDFVARYNTDWLTEKNGLVYNRSKSAAIVSPVQQSLPLPPAAGQVASFAVSFNLPDVPAHRLPALNLPLIFRRHTAAHIIATIPLEPATRIIGVDPSLSTPNR